MQMGGTVTSIADFLARIAGSTAFLHRLFGLSLIAALASCGGPDRDNEVAGEEPVEVAHPAAVEPRPDVYANVTLTADLSALSERQRQMLVLLIEASNVMDDLFWRQAFRDDYADWLASIGVAETRSAPTFIRRT
jgi:hypothetical protein